MISHPPTKVLIINLESNEKDGTNADMPFCLMKFRHSSYIDFYRQFDVK